MKYKVAFVFISLCLHAALLYFLVPWREHISSRSDLITVELLNPVSTAQALQSLAPQKRQRPTEPSTAINQNKSPEPVAKTEAPNSDQTSDPVEGPFGGAPMGIQVTYPKISRMMGEEGRVRIRIGDQGPEIISSSGHPRLDQSVLDSVSQALQQGSRPPQGRELSFIFRLKD